MTGLASSAPSVQAPQGETPAETAAVYRPADHTVDEVKAYVTEHPDEAQTVLAAEVAGNNRVTLVDWLRGL